MPKKKRKTFLCRANSHYSHFSAITKLIPFSNMQKHWSHLEPKFPPWQKHGAQCAHPDNISNLQLSPWNWHPHLVLQNIYLTIIYRHIILKALLQQIVRKESQKRTLLLGEGGERGGVALKLKLSWASIIAWNFFLFLKKSNGGLGI